MRRSKKHEDRWEEFTRRVEEDERLREIERLFNIVASVASSRHAGRAGVGYVRQIGGYGRDAVLAVPDLIRCLKHRQASVRAAAAL